MRLLKLIIFLLLFASLQLWSSNDELLKNEYNDKALKELLEKKSVIGQISLIDQTKTKMDREMESIEEWTGKRYNTENN